MEKLFEDLVARLLFELDDEVQLAAQATYTLDTLGRMTIWPDLVMRSAGIDVAVADTKVQGAGRQGKVAERGTGTSCWRTASGWALASGT